MRNTLRERRGERGWSQAELARRVDVSRQTINALETGKYDPSLPLAFALADLFGCLIEDLFLPDGRADDRAVDAEADGRAAGSAARARGA